MMDRDLDEISGLAVSRRHANTLWMLDDGGHPARLFAVNKRGRRIATMTIAGLVKTDWEDLAAFDAQGKHYLLIADTGDNGGLRRSLQLHVIEEPSALDATAQRTALKPAWSIAFRWPDGARDCEAVAVDAKRGEILLISKKRQPPELFVLPLYPADGSVQIAKRVATLSVASSTLPEKSSLKSNRARFGHQVTAADVSPDGSMLAVLTYNAVSFYRRNSAERWQDAVSRLPEVHTLPWLPQAEALGWSTDGRQLYATGEFSPVPILLLNPFGPN